MELELELGEGDVHVALTLKDASDTDRVGASELPRVPRLVPIIPRYVGT